MNKSFVNINRRDFLKYCVALSALIGLNEIDSLKIAEALEESILNNKVPIIWLEGLSCNGCTSSFLDSSYPEIAELILDTLSLHYQPYLMAAAGNIALESLENTISTGRYILIIEGSIPNDDNKLSCLFAGKPFIEWIDKAVTNASAIISAGTCASYGGIPGTYPMNAEGVSEILNKEKIINIPGCPVHPDWLVGVITTLLISGKVPSSDNLGRPNIFFEKTIHYNCPRRPAFEEGKFVLDFNSDEAKKEYCLLKVGCKGQYTFGDCPKRGWNNKTNWCVGAGAPCFGCTQPEFYQAFSPLYEESDDLVVSGSINLGKNTILKRAGVVTAIAAGSFVFGQVIGGSAKRKAGKKKDVH